MRYYLFITNIGVFMRKLLLFLVLILLLDCAVFAGTKCFMVAEEGHVLQKDGDCDKRHSPCSTFKIAISLMGYNEGILTNAIMPEWENKKQAANPTVWIKNSCIWYSQIITAKLGLEKFKNYVTRFNYGNQNLAGNKGKNDGLTYAWLSSSLQISGLEQIDFLQKLLDSKLPVSDKAQKLTRSILATNELLDGWKLYGKTGAGYLINKDGSRDEDRKIAWFIGWLQKDSRNIVFAHYIEDEERMSAPAGKRAKEMAKERLLKLIK